MIAGQVLGMAAYSVAWLRGGHPERFAATVLLLGYVLSSATFRWKIGGFHLASVVEEIAMMLAFGWLSVRSTRWWPFMTTASLALIVLVNGAPLMDLALSSRDVASAKIGLWFLVDLTVLAGVGERCLAGEGSVSGTQFRAALARRRLRTDADLDRAGFTRPDRANTPPSAPSGSG
jgi:hypothetical protein